MPSAVCEASAEAGGLLAELARIGLKSAISDAGTGGKAAKAAFGGASFNVLVNLGAIKDEAFVKESRHRLAGARVRAEKAAALLDAAVAAELK